MSAGTAAGKVARGAAFMDEHDPGWWRADAIDLSSLDLAEPDLCILGQRCPLPVLAAYCGLPADGEELQPQRFRAYTAYAEVLSGFDEDGGRAELIRWGDEHGFSDSADNGENYPALTTEWRRVITERRAAA